MRKSRSETLWNEEIRRCGVVDIPEKATEESLRRCGHVTRRDEEDWSEDIMELRDQKKM